MRGWSAVLENAAGVCDSRSPENAPLLANGEMRSRLFWCRGTLGERFRDLRWPSLRAMGHSLGDPGSRGQVSFSTQGLKNETTKKKSCSQPS